MKSEITEDQFRAVAKVLLPQYIQLGGLPYRLDAGGLMVGSWRISYQNCDFDAGVRLPIDEIWDDPLDCVKAMRRKVCGTLGCHEIDEQKFEEMSRPFRKSCGLADEIEADK